MVIWITGITASGKTSLGNSLKEDLSKSGYDNVVHLDGDELRKRPDWISGHSIEDRFKILSLLVSLIVKEERKGNIVVVSTVSHIKKMRDYARERIDDFIEVYLNCSVQACELRDYKGFYKRAHDDVENSGVFPGVNVKYEESKDVELILFTGKESFEESSKKLLDFSLKRLKGNI